MKDGIIRTLMLAAVAAFCGVLGMGVALAQSEEEPEWDFEIEESEVARFEVPQWHAKDYGWLFTCRLRVPSTNLVRPITHLEFEGLNADEEVVWSKRQVVRRRDFEGTFKGGEGQFIRAIFKDVPSEVVAVTLRFDGGEELRRGSQL